MPFGTVSAKGATSRPPARSSSMYGRTPIATPSPSIAACKAWPWTSNTGPRACSLAIAAAASQRG
jgi:hypothetical protein